MKVGDVVIARAWGRYMRHLDGKEFVVSRVGRKWFYVNDDSGVATRDRFSISDGQRDGRGHSSDICMETPEVRARRLMVEAARDRIAAWGLELRAYGRRDDEHVLLIAERLGECP